MNYTTIQCRELLTNLFKLVNSEYSSCVSAVCSHLLSEAGGEASVSLW